MKSLPIVWQRLVTPDGQTCQRCHSTHQNLLQAVAQLKTALAPLGLQPVLDTQEIPLDSFRTQPAESNRLWIGGQPLETWLGAATGQSNCCAACEGAPCRTLELAGQSYEAVPEAVIVQAALLAAAAMLGASTTPAAQGCCGPAPSGCCGSTSRTLGQTT
ncbi:MULTISPECIES: DUF2703 domain-containing protein [Giesbergeria]|uniref:DUF2703 domain-containing protein n=1 Tax=Giesbergeria sinuosa TaxID=80883 RepID=A0ABV9QGF8_9BURK